MHTNFSPKHQCVYQPTLEELEEERNDLLHANENGGLVVESLCATIREQKEEINGHKAEIRRLRAEVGEKDRLIKNEVKSAKDIADRYLKSSDAWKSQYISTRNELEQREKEVEDLKAENEKLRYELHTTREGKK